MDSGNYVRRTWTLRAWSLAWRLLSPGSVESALA